jgi:anti-sigma factor RsiW
MACKEFVELVTDYFEGALSQEDARRFEQHIEDCFWCGRYLEQMRVTINTVGRIDEESISPEAKDVLLHAFRDWNAERKPSA